VFSALRMVRGFFVVLSGAVLMWAVACGDDGGADGSNNGAANNGSSNNGAANNGSTNNGSSNNGVQDESVGGELVPPTDEAALIAWVGDGTYTGWYRESAPHDSTGPHFGTVRTFMNDALFESLSAGDGPHPVGSAVVKELYAHGDTVLGRSVMVKVDDSGDAGNNWFWFEVYNGNTLISGRGESACTGCHGDGADFVLTPFPLQ